MRYLIYVLIVVVSLTFRVPVDASVSLTHAASGRAVVLENETLKLVVDPDRGGTVVSFIHKVSNRDIIKRDSKYMGLFMDHFWGQGWPGELLEVPYESQVVKTGPDEAIIKVWRRVAGTWQGGEQKIIQGLLIEKTYTLRKGSDALFCHVAVKNPQSAGRLPAYWPQHVFFAGGDYDPTTDVFYRPSTRGVRASWQGGRADDFLRDPTTGWSAAVDKPKGQGMVFLLDYNDLDMLYDCGGNNSIEWMYDKIPVPAGRTWETDIALVPTEGIREFAHASKTFIAGLEVKRSGNTMTLIHQVRATFDSVQDFKLETKILGAADRRETIASPLPVGTLTTDLRTIEQTLEVKSADPLAILVTARGKSDASEFTEDYFVFFVGGYGYGDNVQQDMSTPVFKTSKPVKKQELMRPEKLARTREAKPRVFIIKGLHTERYQLDKVLSSLDAIVGFGAYSVGQEGPRTTDFPFDYEALMAQDLIIAANANLQCLGKLGLLMVRDYLTHGGNLLLLGGKASYGGGGLIGSGLEDLLPVEVASTNFDLDHLRKSTLTLGTPHFITEGLDLKNENVLCPYLHRAKVCKESTVVLNAGGKPFLVVREVEGGGRLVCVLGAPYGIEDAKAPVFFAWKDSELLMRQVVKWLMDKRE